MGSKSSTQKQYGAEWTVQDQENFNYFEGTTKICSKVQSTMSSVLSTSDHVKKIGKVLNENLTGKLCSVVGKGGDLLAVTSLILDLTGASTDETQEMLKKMMGLMKKMDKKLDNLQKFQAAFQKGFIEAEYKEIFINLRAYDSRSNDFSLLMAAYNSLTKYLSITKNINKAVDCENKQYQWINSTIKCCQCLKGLLQGMIDKNTNQKDKITLNEMLGDVLAYEKIVKSLCWAIIQARFKQMKLYKGYWYRNHTRKCEKIEFFFEDDLYSGCRTRNLEEQKGVSIYDQILMKMLKELLVQLGFDDKAEMALFLKEYCAHPSHGLILKFDDDWKIYGRSPGDTWYETYELIKHRSLKLQDVMRNM